MPTFQSPVCVSSPSDLKSLPTPLGDKPLNWVPGPERLFCSLLQWVFPQKKHLGLMDLSSFAAIEQEKECVKSS